MITKELRRVPGVYSVNSDLSKQTEVKISRYHSPIVFIPKAFPEENDREKLFKFRGSEIKYLDAIHRGNTHEKSCQIAGLTLKEGNRILTRKKAKEYLCDLYRQKAVVEGLTQEWFMSELAKVWRGDKVLQSREQMDAMKEIGARIAPKPEKNNGINSNQQIIINIGRIEEALKRQEIVEAQVINGSTASDRTISASL